MTLNLCCNESTNCCEEKDSVSARILSKNTTNEILGENLSALIAIGKDCKPVLFMPYGVSEASNCEHFLNEDDSTTLLEITIRVPKHTITAKRYCVCYPPGGGPPYGCWK